MGEKDVESIFSSCGKMTSCTVVRDRDTQISLGFAFVEYDCEKAVEDSISKYNRYLQFCVLLETLWA